LKLFFEHGYKVRQIDGYQQLQTLQWLAFVNLALFAEPLFHFPLGPALFSPFVSLISFLLAPVQPCGFNFWFAPLWWILERRPLFWAPMIYCGIAINTTIACICCAWGVSWFRQATTYPHLIELCLNEIYTYQRLHSKKLFMGKIAFFAGVYPIQRVWVFWYMRREDMEGKSVAAERSAWETTRRVEMPIWCTAIMDIQSRKARNITRLEPKICAQLEATNSQHAQLEYLEVSSLEIQNCFFKFMVPTKYPNFSLKTDH